MSIRIAISRVAVSFVALVLFTSTLGAQDWAREKLEKSPRHGEWVEVKHGYRNVRCFLVFPEVKEKAAAIIVVHEIFGLTEWVRKRRRPARGSRIHRDCARPAQRPDLLRC